MMLTLSEQFLTDLWSKKRWASWGVLKIGCLYVGSHMVNRRSSKGLLISCKCCIFSAFWGWIHSRMKRSLAKARVEAALAPTRCADIGSVVYWFQLRSVDLLIDMFSNVFQEFSWYVLYNHSFNLIRCGYSPLFTIWTGDSSTTVWYLKIEGPSASDGVEPLHFLNFHAAALIAAPDLAVGLKLVMNGPSDCQENGQPNAAKEVPAEKPKGRKRRVSWLSQRTQSKILMFDGNLFGFREVFSLEYQQGVTTGRGGKNLQVLSIQLKVKAEQDDDDYE